MVFVKIKCKSAVCVDTVRHLGQLQSLYLLIAEGTRFNSRVFIENQNILLRIVRADHPLKKESRIKKTFFLWQICPVEYSTHTSFASKCVSCSRYYCP